jgi:hypothetical protein
MTQHEAEDWFSSMTEQGTKMAHTLAIITLWSIWKQRNAVIFQDLRISTQSLFSIIKDTSYRGLLWPGRSCPPLWVAPNFGSN